MLGGLFIASLIGTVCHSIKEACEPKIPAENWANKDLYYQDVMNGVSAEQRMKNLDNGKYKLNTSYSEPHRDARTGKVIIENSLLYKEDVKKYGAYQAKQWVKQGKYNLSPEELAKEIERINKHIEKLYSL